MNHQSGRFIKWSYLHTKYLDSDHLKLKTFVFLAVFNTDPSKYHYTDIQSSTIRLKQASTMLNNVFNYGPNIHMDCIVREPFFDLMIVTATWLCAY